MMFGERLKLAKMLSNKVNDLLEENLQKDESRKSLEFVVSKGIEEITGEKELNLTILTRLENLLNVQKLTALMMEYYMLNEILIELKLGSLTLDDVFEDNKDSKDSNEIH